MIRNILISFFFFISATTILAQRTNSSPYSYFGIGEKFSNTTVEQSSMGGIGVAFSNYGFLNFSNPAAYSDLRFATYSFGLLNNDLTVKSATTSQSSTSTSLSYIAFGFPIGSKAGFSAGMQPVSSIGYSLSTSVFDANDRLTQVSIFEGNGGVNRLYGSFGIKITKNLSFGVEGDFNFGSIENGISVLRADVFLSTKYNEVSRVTGGSLKLGMQYHKELESKLVISTGATVKLANSLTVTGDDYLYSLTFSPSGSEIPRDTISSNRISGRFNLPIKTNFGVGIGKFDNWYAGIEYESQDALTTTDLLSGGTNSAYTYGKSSRISFGGFFLPKVNSISSYWERVTYRAGLRYEKTGLSVDGSGSNSNFTPIDDFGISFGLGLPLKRLSTINMGFEFGKRGTLQNNLIQENYFNLRVGLSLTDMNWFIQRKID
jgi:hypothetical protein